MLSSNQKGAIAEAAIEAEATKRGIAVFRPNLDARYDMIFDTGESLLRVQCKWAPVKGDVILIRGNSSWHSPTRGYLRSGYSGHEVDAIAAYCPDNGTCYYVPIEDFDGQLHFQLRLSPARNGQMAAIHWEPDYRFGAVAQLEERGHGMAQVRGSSPLSSTLVAPPAVVGADEFRKRLGSYLQCVAAGEEITVTYRGRPRARMVPVEPAESGSDSATGPPQLELVRPA